MKNLKQIICESINTEQGRLDISGCNLKKLPKEIKKMTYIKELLISGNEITDLSPLSGLTNLRMLEVDNNEITDLSPISGLTNLEFLSILYSKITDLSPISGLTNLSSLYIRSEKKITDISPLSGLRNIRTISIEVQDEQNQAFPSFWRGGAKNHCNDKIFFND